MSIGVPPVQPCGDVDVVVRDCVLLDWHVPHAEYVKVVQVVCVGVVGGT